MRVFPKSMGNVAASAVAADAATKAMRTLCGQSWRSPALAFAISSAASARHGTIVLRQQGDFPAGLYFSCEKLKKCGSKICTAVSKHAGLSILILLALPQPKKNQACKTRFFAAKFPCPEHFSAIVCNFDVTDDADIEAPLVMIQHQQQWKK